MSNTTHSQLDISASEPAPASTVPAPPVCAETCVHDEASQSEDGAGFVFFELFIGVLLVLVLFMFPFWCLMEYLGERRVSQIDPAGELVAVLPVGGWSSNSLIQTTTGFYTVAGDVALVRGLHFQLETRDNDAQFLCDSSRKFCARVIGRGLDAAARVQVPARP